MKIFQIPFTLRSGGGTTRQRELLADDRVAYHLAVDAQDLSIPEKQEHIRHNMTLHPIDTQVKSSVIPILNRNGVQRELSRRTEKAVRGLTFDLVHGHNPAIYGRIAQHIARKKKTPFVYELHRMGYDSSNRSMYSLKSKYRKELERSEEGRMAQAADIVIVQTETMKERAIELFKLKEKKIFILPAGINSRLFDPQKHIACRDIKRGLNGTGDRICFFYCGRLAEDTGILFFLENVLKLPSDLRSRMQVVILGSGPLEEYTQKVSQENPDVINFLGLVDYLEIPNFYIASDVQIIPYPDFDCWKTNVPAKMLEGMAMQRLVFASQLRGITDVLGSHGVTYRPEDPVDFRQKIEEVILNYSAFTSTRESARKVVTEQYDWQVMRDQLYTLYQELISR